VIHEGWVLHEQGDLRLRELGLSVALRGELTLGTESLWRYSVVLGPIAEELPGWRAIGVEGF